MWSRARPIRGRLPYVARFVAFLGLLAVIALPAIASASARGGLGYTPIFGHGRELSLTLFKPGLWINQTISGAAGSSHVFSMPKAEYVGLYAGSVGAMPPGSKIMAAHAGLGLGRQDLRLYSEAGGMSRGPYHLKAYWLCFEYGPALNLRVGRVFATPSIGGGLAFSMADVARPDRAGRDQTWQAIPILSLDLPIRVHLRNRSGLSVAYHVFRAFLIQEATYRFGSEKVWANLGDAHEIRVGVFLFR